MVMQRSDASYITLSTGVVHENTSDKRHTTTKRTAVSCHARENTIANTIRATYTQRSMGKVWCYPVPVF